MPKKLLRVLVLLTVSIAGLAISTSAATASGPIFTVMNTSETPPDGVWFRNSPHTADTDRVTGHGVYMNERVQSQCYAWGDAVGAYHNTLWYFVLNVTRPTNAGVTNQGYLNAHYINDGLAANQIEAGVGQCGAPPTPTPVPTPLPTPTPSGGAVYYSPYGTGSHLPNANTSTVYTVAAQDWEAGGTCNPDKAKSKTPTMVGGKIVSTLAGWSLGRVGTLYELKALLTTQPSVAADIKYVLLIDPGSYDELKASCDTSVGSTFASWLKAVPDAHLVILSGPDTLYSTDGRSRFGSAGIQDFYFNPIRSADSGGNLRSRVMVCNYTDPSESISQAHQTIYKNASYLIGEPPLTSCPAIHGMTSGVRWSP